MSKSNQISPINKAALELLHHILGHRSTISFMDRDTVNVWKNIELRIYQHHFCTSCQISSMKENSKSKNPLKPKEPLKWDLCILFQK